jgi:hypothetical protein
LEHLDRVSRRVISEHLLATPAYQLNPDGTAALQRFTTSLWTSALDSFGDAAASRRSAPVKGRSRS